VRRKAIIVTFMAVLMLIVALQPALGSDGLQGYAISEYNEDVSIMDSFIIAYADNPDQSVSENYDGTGFQMLTDDFGAFSYSCVGDRAWDPTPAPEIGDNIYFISEAESGGVGYYWAAWREMVNVEFTAESQGTLTPQYERLPQPVHEVTYINGEEADVTIHVESPAYTDYDFDSEEAVNQGTYELFESYNVYVSENGGDWTLLGETSTVDGDYDDPLVPGDDSEAAGNPYETTTGLNEYTAEGLDPDATYNFRVSANLAFPDTEVGTYETQGFGEASEDINPGDLASEFGLGMLIPVVATIGMFVALTVYRRKKDE